VLANELCLSVNKNPDVFYVHAKRVKLECSIQTTAPLSETFAFRVGQQKLKHHFFLFQRKKKRAPLSPPKQHRRRHQAVKIMDADDGFNSNKT
jgi:hypothetical protein